MAEQQRHEEAGRTWTGRDDGCVQKGRMVAKTRASYSGRSEAAE